MGTTRANGLSRRREGKKKKVGATAADRSSGTSPYRGFLSLFAAPAREVHCNRGVHTTAIEPKKRRAQPFPSTCIGLAFHEWGISARLSRCDDCAAHRILTKEQPGGGMGGGSDEYIRARLRPVPDGDAFAGFFSSLSFFRHKRLAAAFVDAAREWVRYERRARPIRAANASSAMRGRGAAARGNRGVRWPPAACFLPSSLVASLRPEPQRRGYAVALSASSLHFYRKLILSSSENILKRTKA